MSAAPEVAAAGGSRTGSGRHRTGQRAGVHLAELIGAGLAVAVDRAL